MTTVTPDEVVLAGYFELSLTGLETLMFTNVTGLSHSVMVNPSFVQSSEGAHAEKRTVTPPNASNLTMQHAVVKGVDVWKWLDDTIAWTKDAKKSGTLFLKALGDGQIQKSWKLDNVYLTAVQLDQLGVGAAPNLTATLSVIAGDCAPMPTA